MNVLYIRKNKVVEIKYRIFIILFYAETKILSNFSRLYDN